MRAVLLKNHKDFNFSFFVSQQTYNLMVYRTCTVATYEDHQKTTFLYVGTMPQCGGCKNFTKMIHHFFNYITYFIPTNIPKKKTYVLFN